ncbi:hypothetical protein FSP39_021473 [Pinctada imbricata]|uniref:Protein kinase domain-containing protein n=1 Tax=Pinctada imbricata TaxID=66713 RepID=A0AA89C4W9_PINIB|nr:hypothetical protein FSP39_021473 [Pinctada imbricata]
MYRYNWEIFRLEKTGNELREQGQKYLSPIHSFVMNHTGSRTYNYDYTPSQPGVYSMILEASDRANNSIYVRRFVIFDPTSEITTTSTPLKALSGNVNADYKWQTWTQGGTNDITFSWEGHFINKLHKDGGFLGSINDYPPQLNDMNVPPGNIFKKTIDKLLTDPSSERHQTAFPNVNGITSFEVAKTTKGGIPTFIQKALQQTHTFPGGSITDGTFVELWTKARDIMGNTKTSKLLLGFDRTPPVLHNTTIRRNIGVGFTYTSTLSFKAYDRHSGVKQIDFRIIEKATGIESKSGNIPAATSQIGNLTIFKGIGTYQGINNLTVTSKENTVTLKWQFVDSCYQRRSLLLKYWGPDGNENGKRVAKDATEFDISNLQPSTTYNASLLIKYDGVNSDEKWLSFTTSLSLLLILILIIVIMAAMMRRGKLKRVNQALAPIVQPISRTIRRKSRSSYSKYEMGGYDIDDIYMYGGITYERTPDWQHDPDQLSIGGLIQVGRFARIYNATVKTGRKSKHVAAKVLKDEFNEEDSILMKAKINFFATKVGKHPCVMGFEGAVMDHPDFGPVMILELCQGGTMKDWLIENKERADDEIIERLFRFSFDIARGMEYLAEKEILHMRLAARNVLLTGNIEAKVAGFGPRHGESEDDDRTSRKERIPIKWIAPECLDKPNSASEKSDVWSFGITIWEIFSMGQTPYGNVKSKDLKKWLKKGNKLQKPEYSDDTHYEIMKECWDFDPVMRPPFSNIHRKIESLFRQSSGDVYYYDR